MKSLQEIENISFDKLEEKTFGPKEAVEDPEYLDDDEETGEETEEE